MVMPPFPPPQYMEAPAYILPHPHIQPVDYRRLLHTQVHAPSAPYQNPNQTRRIRPLHTVPIRETVNSAVQTEPTQRGRGVSRDLSPHIDSDSGHGTASSSPSSSSNFRKQGSTEVENYTLPCSNAKDLQVNGPAVEHGFNVVHPTEKITAKSCIRATVETQQRHKDNADQENVPSHRNGHCNMWSVGSPDSMVPVCSSSQQEDELVKERRVSVPDILMSWGNGTPQATLLKMTDKVLPKEDHPLPSYQTDENSVDQNPTETKNDSVVADGSDNDVDAENILSSKDGETIFKILKLPFALHELLSESRGENKPMELVDSFRPGLPYTDELLQSLNKSHQLSDEQESSSETNPHDNTAEITPYQMSFNSVLMKRKMSESIWSVESLAPFIPAKDRLLQRGPFEPDTIIEMTEDAENGGPVTQNDNQIVKPCKERRRSYRFSLSDSVPVSDSLLIFSTPAKKMGPSKTPQMGSEIISETMGAKQGQVVAPLEKDAPFSPTSNMTLSTPTDEDVEEIRSSEPEANRSPNQESFIVNERQERSGSPEHEETLLLNVELERISPMGQLILQNGVDMEEEDGVCQLQNEQLCVPRADQRIAEVSPSKGHLVDCGTQCTTKCHCEEEKSSMGPRKHNFKNSGDSS